VAYLAAGLFLLFCRAKPRVNFCPLKRVRQKSAPALLRETGVRTKPRLRLRLKGEAEGRVRAGHPWVFDRSIAQQNRAGEVGELAVIYDRKDQFLAFGLFDPDSPIRVRVLHTGKPALADAPWWEQRLEEAISRRVGLFDDQTNGFRWINGESDGWPGLVLDRYADVLVLKLYTTAWFPHLKQVRELIQSRLQPASIVLRLSRNLQGVGREKFGFTEGSVLAGEPVDGPMVFLESGLRLEADVLKGQKTGFFLDQRENRREVERVAAGRRVLNCFSFSGAFSLYAARGGAGSVTNLDISSHALSSARRNFGLNPGLRRAQPEDIQADAFEWLAANEERQFDLIILDPPSMARREVDREGALRAYQSLARNGLNHLAPGGILVACSCSAHVSADEFFTAIHQVARDSRRVFSEIKTTRHAPDHPVNFPEADYLKAIYLEF
jgi:23S rRNA (cytosine1962-C5)-methyltransferase